MHMSKRAVQIKVSKAKARLSRDYSKLLQQGVTSANFESKVPEEVQEIFSLLKLLVEHRIEIKD